MARVSSQAPRTWVYAAPTRRRRSRLRWLRRIVLFCLVLLAAAVLVLVYVIHVYAPSLRSEARTIPAVVHFQLARHNSTYVPLAGISPNLQHAIVAVEDRRFYHHPGIDPQGMARALWVNATSHYWDQGGSTLEEQLVKRAIVPDDQTLREKLRRIALAWAVDQEFPKNRVLELYLNAAYYGRGAYGAGAASQIYFGWPASELTAPQAAFLAALPQAPTPYGSHPLSALVTGRQHTVLRDMESQGYLSPQVEQRAEKTPLVFAFPNP